MFPSHDRMSCEHDFVIIYIKCLQIAKNMRERQYSATTYIVSKKGVLLHKHQKLGLILPVGGHIEENELPDEAAIREVLEETNLIVDLIAPDHSLNLESSGKTVHSPFHILLQDLGDHDHIDLVYYAYCMDPEDLVPENKGMEYRWYTKKDLKESRDIQDDVKSCALQALTICEGTP